MRHPLDEHACACEVHDGNLGCTAGNMALVQRLLDVVGPYSLDARRTQHILGHESRVQSMTVEEFRALPYREKYNKHETFNSLVILPAVDEADHHESGYRCMDFVGVRAGYAICRLAGGADALNLDGIGGYNERLNEHRPSGIIAGDWQFDCLPASGLLQVWNNRGQILVTEPMSSFEVYCVRRTG